MNTSMGHEKINDAERSHVSRLLSIMQENLQRSSQLHQAWLQLEAKNLEVIALGLGIALPHFEEKSRREELISKTQLQEFGTGSIARCLGPDFEILDHRKSPRIPNGDLLMMDRVVDINARRGDFSTPASIVAEYEVLTDAWYLRENSYPGIPLGVLLEIALQPCGILSAYLGTSLVLPPGVNIFRNLDGSIQIFSSLDLSGRTITTKAALLSSAAVGGMTIQSYTFDLDCEGHRIASGQSSFGYFSQPVMDKQSGLDMGKTTLLSASRPKDSENRNHVLMNIGMTTGVLGEKSHFALIDRLELDEGGGRYELGMLRGEKKLKDDEWFYANHFFQDPVMPGSLGLEVLVQAVWKFIEHIQARQAIPDPVLSFAQKGALSWKYRGQITPANRHIVFEAHFKHKFLSDAKSTIVFDADFWIDGIRIYAFSDICMECREGNRL